MNVFVVTYIYTGIGPTSGPQVEGVFEKLSDAENYVTRMEKTSTKEDRYTVHRSEPIR